MIYAFGGRNFYSFKDPFRVDFRIRADASERTVFVNDDEGVMANRVMGVFGANASGKTHLLKALGFLHWFIVHSASENKPNAGLVKSFFRFTSKQNDATELWIEFRMDGEMYRYDVKYRPTGVVKESLKKRVERLGYVFKREWDAKKEGYRFKAQHGFSDAETKLAQRRNASFIATALLVEHPFARRFDAFFSSFYGNVGHFGRTEQHDPDVDNVMLTASYFNDNPEMLEWVNKRLAYFDLGLDAIKIEERKFLDDEGKEETKEIPLGVHLHGGVAFSLSMFEESRGTQALFVLLRHILPVLLHGGVAYIDEFELGLHSHMIPRLLDLFYSRKHNEKGAQVIFTTHADYVIQRLEKCQMLFVEKDDEGASSVYGLADIKGVRNDENHYFKYHAGAYGGVPNI